MSLTILQLDLAPLMEEHAVRLLELFPSVRYTSGRRSLHQQAHAMAVNHVQDKEYLVRTYVHAAEFLAAIENDGLEDSVDSVSEAIYNTLLEMPELIKAAHLNGDAVDLVPMETKYGISTLVGMDVISWIKACPATTDFRTREGGLRRWHWACVPRKDV